MLTTARHSMARTLLTRNPSANAAFQTRRKQPLSSSAAFFGGLDFNLLHLQRSQQLLSRGCSVNRGLVQLQSSIVSAKSTISPSRPLSTDNKPDKKEDGAKEVQPPVGLVKRFKKMWKDYWYVMIPVHCVTSVGWFGGFYLLCKSGIDVPAILASMGTSEAYLEKISQSDYAYYALAYACYKIATPARYTVTIGGTTYAIRYLSETGFLKKTSSELRVEGAELRHKMQEKTKAEFQARKDHFNQEWHSAWEKFAKKRKKF